MISVTFAILAHLFGMAQLSQRHRGMEPKTWTAVEFTAFLLAALVCAIMGW
jgi:hypothetical protein